MKLQGHFNNAYGIVLSKRKHLEMLVFLLCLETISSCSYLGFISISPILVTTLHIFVIVAAMYFGPAEAMAVAGVFGIASMWKASVTAKEIGDIVFSPLLSGKPFPSILMAVVSRLLFGLTAGLLFRWFFSKKRKHRSLGIVIITIFTTLIHSMLVYACMYIFFDASNTQTGNDFGSTLIINNAILYLLTVFLVLGFDHILRNNKVKEFLVVTSEETGERSLKQKKLSLILAVGVSAFSIFVCTHFMSRLNLYIRENGGNMSEDYYFWIYALFLQFIIGFAATFILLALFFRWNRDYYAALTLRTNEQAMKLAQSANRSKSAFLFNMSHDIRTPMNAILGYTNIALRHYDDPEKVCDSLNKINISGGHLLNLINDILEMSRIEAGKMEIVNVPVNIIDATKGVQYMSQALAATKDIQFTLSIGEIRNTYIYADELHTNQVIINLISNAIKYTAPGGKVDYRIEQITDPNPSYAQYRIMVEDNGIGMSEEFQSHLFESFAREHTATVSKQEGAGLGLAIVKNIVDLIGGAIYVQSKQGVGTKITVELPFKVMNDDEIKTVEESKNKDRVPVYNVELKNKKVLLVEDNELNREIAIDILEEESLVVEVAGDGTDAVSILKQKGPEYYDIILMDIQMPIMNGYEATKAIRKMYPYMKTPIIAISANAFEEDKLKFLEAGMNAHIAKPIDIRELFDTMSDLTGRED